LKEEIRDFDYFVGGVGGSLSCSCRVGLEDSSSSLGSARPGEHQAQVSKIFK